MKTRLFQLNVVPGRPSENVQTMLEAIADAKACAIEVLVFPEMSVPGYLLGDEWERESFLAECEHCGHRIREAAKGITVIFGNVAIDRTRINEDGRVRKYNAVFVAENQAFVNHPTTGLDYFIKVLMPNYREFDDNRHFYDPRKLAYELQRPIEDLIQPVLSKHGSLGCILCEDGWDDDYNVSPVAELSRKGAQVLINLSSSPYTFDKNSKRNRVFGAHAKKFKLPLLYVNCCGLQDNGKTLYTFDGATCAYNTKGEMIGTTQTFKQSKLDLNLSLGAGVKTDVTLKETDACPVDYAIKPDGVSHQFEAISYGIKHFMARIGLKKVVIGVSGGIDSALNAALYRQLLPADNLLLVSMPGPFTSNTTKQLARALADNLQCYFAEIPIQPSVEISEQQLKQARFEKAKHASKSLNVSDFVLENIQARDRSARVLAGVAAAFGGGFSCNANKTEMTVGYSTLYGDLGGFLASLADLWKAEIYQLASFLNQEVYGKEVIPQGSIDIVPSAELSNKQNVDEGKGDPLHYPYHDLLFKSWVERWSRATPEDNLSWYLNNTLEAELGYKGRIEQLFATPQEFIADLERWWTLYQGMAVAKRIQAPPVLAIKRRAFGFDHRESQLGARFSSRYLQLKNDLE